jgi:hypothetical protein
MRIGSFQVYPDINVDSPETKAGGKGKASKKVAVKKKKAKPK